MLSSLFPFNFCLSPQNDDFSICGIAKREEKKSPLLSAHSQNETESPQAPSVPAAHTDTIHHSVQIALPSEPKPISNPIHLALLSDVVPKQITKEQSSFLDIPDPEGIENQQKSTHYDEELGLTHYVSMHNLAGKQSSRKLSNDGVEVASARRTGHQREIILNYGGTEPQTESTPLPSTINVWQSKQPQPEFETPVISSNMISVNDNFIVADDAHGLYAFDVKRNEWDLCIKYSVDIQILDQSICFDDTRNIIYLIGEMDDWGTILYIDITSKETEIIKDDLENIGRVPFILMVGDTLNLFTGSYDEDSVSLNGSTDSDAYVSESNDECQKHLIWNHNTSEFESVFTFPQGVYGDGIVYIKSKKALLLLDKDGIWIKYSSKQWIKACDVELPIAMHRDQCTLSRYENYLLAYGCGNAQNKIFIFDVRDLNHITYTESVVRSPEFGENYKCLAEDNEEDEMLIAGYIREMSELFQMDLTNNIITIIEMMYIEQYIHIISDENCHFKAVLHHILDYNYCNDYCLVGT